MAAAAVHADGSAAAREAMIPALNDEAWQVRVEAVEYLGMWNDTAELIRPRLDDRHAAVRRAARLALFHSN
jgi:hypothetical protein